MTSYDETGITDGLDAPYAVEFHETLGSSNDRANELPADAPETVVVADEQTAPRGRSGREWVSPSGGVWFSLAINPDVPTSETPAYTLVMAVAVTDASREAGVEARIKWPNDVLVGHDGDRGGRKLCGILTEAGENRLVIGVGWNVNVDPAVLPVADATSLRAERGEPADRRRLLQRCLERFHDARTSLRDTVDRWRELSDTVGRRVRLDTPDGPVVGRAVDVQFPGALVVQTDDGDERTVTAGDCDHLRPIGR